MSDNSSSAASSSSAHAPDSAGAAPCPAKRTTKCSSCGRKGAKAVTCHNCVLCKAHSADEHIDPAGHAPSCYRYDADAAPVVCSTCHATFTAKSILTMCTRRAQARPPHVQILRCAVPRSCELTHPPRCRVRCRQPGNCRVAFMQRAHQWCSVWADWQVSCNLHQVHVSWPHKRRRH
jgi:RecJ-like exonuclease